MWTCYIALLTVSIWPMMYVVTEQECEAKGRLCMIYFRNVAEVKVRAAILFFKKYYNFNWFAAYESICTVILLVFINK